MSRSLSPNKKPVAKSPNVGTQQSSRALSVGKTDKASVTKRRASTITSVSDLHIDSTISTLEMADLLLVMANRNRKMLLQYEREILPHTLQRMIRNCDVPHEATLDKINAVLEASKGKESKDNVKLFSSVSDNADKLEELEKTSERLRQVARTLDQQLSVEIIE
ncbi:hypothetical protein EON65_34955 [archaeon]|nr:MAG: hypothetical protein EON65_34955 [archaeon]